MRLLYVVHGLPPHETSGTPLQAHGYACAMAAEGHDVTVATTDTRLGRPEQADIQRHANAPYAVATFAGTHARWAEWAQSDWSTWAKQPGARDRPFRKLLAKVRPDLVHVIDLVHLPSEWPRLAAEQGIPVVRTFCNAEDLCGLIEPIHGPTGRCDTPIDPGQCAEHCARLRPVALPAMTTSLGDLERRVQEMVQQGTGDIGPQLEVKRAQLLHDIEHTYAACVFATGAWRDYFAQTVPIPADRAHVIPLGTATSSVPPAQGIAERPVVFGYFAPPTRNKGMDVLVAAVKDPRIAGRNDVRFAIHGPWPDQDAASRAQVQAMPNVEVLGPYAAEDLDRVMASIDVGLSISRFETFHRVTREVLGAGRAVIGTDAPGIGEVVRDGVNGLTIPGGDAGALTVAILRLLDDRELLARCQAGAAATHIDTHGDEVTSLTRLYDALT